MKTVTRPLPTARMLDLAAAVLELTRRQGFAPSYRQLAEVLGVSLPRCRDLAWEAKRRGLVQFQHGTARSIRVVDLKALRSRRA